ncbi:glycosyl transferase [Methanocalculus chunghsingensis]|uniref:Glycosyl transferase n=1 Tax=Methanocalculus chunghsingensis TaxID=156457 RepID=A0A8J7W9M3_9EURY|nr:flippase activity-associated protein Agl23 [Methanocalculus chunghsingensis]MBR1369165.1 glycosyl transferase [Methanocalculus chunghsingensis]
MKAAPDTSIFQRLLSPELLLFYVILLAAILRFAFLDLKLYHHDEVVHAWFAYELLTKGTYIYDPQFHGPFLFYLTAGIFSLFGDSDLVGRLLPAFLGTALIALVYPLYRMGYLDARQMLVAAVLLAFSPEMVYFSRFLRNDIFIAFFTLLLIVAACAYFRYEKLRYALVAAVAAALGMTSKENMPIVLVILGSYLLFAIWTRRLVFPITWRRDLISATILGAGIIALFYSSFGSHPEIVLQAGQMAISHWMEMHGVERLGGPWYFYLVFLVLYEVPILILAALGMIHFILGGTIIGSIRSLGESGKSDRMLLSRSGISDEIRAIFCRPDPGITYDPKFEFIRFSIWWMIASLVVYAYIGEKVPWLILHQLLPMIFVATFMLDRAKVVIIGLGIIFLFGMTMHIAFTPADIAEPIVQVQNSEDLRILMKWIDESDRVAIATDIYWPLPWYYRGERWEPFTLYGDRPNEGSLISGNYDLIITHDRNSFDALPGYEKVTLRHSYWVTYHEVKGNLVWYYFTRQVATGGQNFDVFRRVA